MSHTVGGALSDRIRDVDVFALNAVVERPFAFSQPGLVTSRGALVVRLRTETGLVGYGEGVCFGFQPPQAAAAIARDVLAPLVLGQPISDSRTLFWRAFNRLRDFGATGVTTAALSAIDIAIWDLRGKALDSSVADLLGGRFRTDVGAYVTSFYSGDDGPDPRESADRAQQYVSEGYSALKLKVGFGIERDVELMRAVRSAVGESTSLMVDANRGYNFGLARRLLPHLEDLGVTWLEEPMALAQTEDYRELRRIAGSVLIAGGESEAASIGFWPLLTRRMVDVLQPDLGIAGGFTGVLPIIDAAQASGQAVCPHVWGTVISQAAALQMIACVPMAPMSRGGFEPIFEFDLSDHPFRSRLSSTKIEATGGRVQIPNGPGLGIQVNDEELETLCTGAGSW